MRCASNIPKNLIRIFLLVAFASLGYIAYIISNEKYSDEFLNKDRQFEA